MYKYIRPLIDKLTDVDPAQDIQTKMDFQIY